MRLSTTGSHSKAAIEPARAHRVAHRDADRDERHGEDDGDEGPRGPHQGGPLGGGAPAPVEEGVDDLAELLGGGTQPGVAGQVGVVRIADGRSATARIHGPGDGAASRSRREPRRSP